MRWFIIILCILCTVSNPDPCLAQKHRNADSAAGRQDSVLIPISQNALFISPKKNLLATHFDAVLAATRVGKTDRSDLGFAATVKGLYSFTGVLYVNMGLGISRLRSLVREDTTGKTLNKATVATLPLGIGFTIGDDRAQIINNIDFFPVYYIDHPEVKRPRTFTWGVGMDLGFHIRIRQRLHLGMVGKLQLFQPYDKDESQSFPRYGLAGAGLILRYD